MCVCVFAAWTNPFRLFNIRITLSESLSHTYAYILYRMLVRTEICIFVPKYGRTNISVCKLLFVMQIGKRSQDFSKCPFGENHILTVWPTLFGFLSFIFSPYFPFSKHVHILSCICTNSSVHTHTHAHVAFVQTNRVWNSGISMYTA